MIVGKHFIDTKIIKEIRDNLNELKKNIRKIEAEKDLKLSFEEKFVKKSEFIYLIDEIFENFLNGGLLANDRSEIMELEMFLDYLASEIKELSITNRVNKIKWIIDNFNYSNVEIELLDIKGEKSLITQVDGKEDKNTLTDNFYEELNKNKVFEQQDGFCYITKGLYIHENENGAAIIDLTKERYYPAKGIVNMKDNNILILEQENKQELYLIDKKRKLKGSCIKLSKKVIKLEKSEGEKEIFLLHESKYFKIEFIKKHGKYYEYEVKDNKKIEQENLISEMKLNKTNEKTNKNIEGKLAKKVLLSENYNLINIGSYENLRIKGFEDGIEVLEFRNNNKRVKFTETIKINSLEYSDREVIDEKNIKIIVLEDGKELKKYGFYEYHYEKENKFKLNKINYSYDNPCLNIEVIYKLKENSVKINYNNFLRIFDIEVPPIIIRE